jgi:hypothetical protein
MKIIPCGNNETEIRIGEWSIFVSYRTPVAAHDGRRFFETEKKWSRTTNGHIRKWLNGQAGEKKPQSFFDALLKTIGEN